MNNIHEAKTIEALTKALEIGSYGVPGDLRLGAPLQVEDLSATLKLVHFRYHLPITVAQYNRFLKNLRERNIMFAIREYEDWQVIPENMVRKVEITVGNRVLVYALEFA